MPWGRAIQWEQRIVATRVHRYIAVSRGIARQLQCVFRVPAHKISVIHNAVALSEFTRHANPALRANLSGGAGPVVLTVARLDQQKGVEYLVEAAALVPGATFLVAGEGPERGRLERRAAELGLDTRVLFLGHRQDIPDLLAACDVFVLPSLFEGLALSILEAMAAGKPVIATAIEGTSEVIRDGENGLLIPPTDPTALASAVRQILGDPVRAQRLAAAGRARVQREFSTEILIERTMGVYSELLAARELQQVR
jgi:glycosyltransferase involved in cell wall biosynthesis